MNYVLLGLAAFLFLAGVVAFAVVAGLAAYLLTRKKKPAALPASPAAPSPDAGHGVNLIQSMRAAGLVGAGRKLESVLGDHEASQVVSGFAQAASAAAKAAPPN